VGVTVQDQTAEPHPSNLCTSVKLGYSNISTKLALNLKKLSSFLSL